MEDGTCKDCDNNSENKDLFKNPTEDTTDYYADKENNYIPSYLSL